MLEKLGAQRDTGNAQRDTERGLGLSSTVKRRCAEEARRHAERISLGVWSNCLKHNKILRESYQP